MQLVGDTATLRRFSDVRTATPEAVAALRRALGQFARSAGADQAQCEALRLAVSEAVTNVVLHAYGNQPGPVHVTASIAGSEMWVTVADDGHGITAPSARPGLGQGLALIGAVSDSITILRRPSGGTELRLRLALRVRRSERMGPAPHSFAA